MKLIGSRVLLEPITEERKTAGGIILAETSRPKYLKGRVVHIGKGTESYKMEGSIGDVCYYPPGVGSDIELEGQKLILINEPSIFFYL